MLNVTEGDRAPDFVLPDDSGKQVALSQLAGKPLVLFFYPKDDTSGCTREALDFTESLAAFNEKGVKVIGISPDSVATHQKFKKKHGLTMTLLADEDKRVLEGYGVWVEKSMYGRKYMGVERTTLLIDSDGKIVKIWEKVKVPGHVEDVLNTVKEKLA